MRTGTIIVSSPPSASDLMLYIKVQASIVVINWFVAMRVLLVNEEGVV